MVFNKIYHINISDTSDIVNNTCNIKVRENELDILSYYVFKEVMPFEK